MSPSAQPITVALLGAGARGELNLGTLIKERPDLIKIVAVAEPHDGRRERFIKEYGIKREFAFRDYRELLERPRLADAVINALPCRLHFESTPAALAAGYHVLLEKPMALTPGQCIVLTRSAAAKGRLLAVATQNRYNRIYLRAKQLLAEGVVGRIMNIDCAENIGYWHFILSYVRGIHHHSSMSHSFMMAKGIHDLDLILWLTGLTPLRVSSFGSLRFFTPENAPAGAPERCAEGCPAEAQCQFSALKQYLKPGRPDIPVQFFYGQSLEAVKDFVRHPRFRTMSSIVTQDDPSEAGIRKALAETSFGRCVFRSPNNVVDHQCVNLEFEGGATAAYSLSGFSLVWERTLNLHGTRGELRTADFSGRLETRTFNPARVRRERFRYHGILHGGGDRVILREFALSVQAGKPTPILPLAEVSLESHLLGFAAEKARTEGTVIDLLEFRKLAEMEADKITARQ
jgi:predicted dehydrogenase